MHGIVNTSNGTDAGHDTPPERQDSAVRGAQGANRASDDAQRASEIGRLQMLELVEYHLVLCALYQLLAGNFSVLPQTLENISKAMAALWDCGEVCLL